MDRTDGWTAAGMPDLDGKRVVVTGANSGVGYQATRAFAAKGAHVVMACRSLERGEAAANEIAAETSRGSFSVRRLDLADLGSVRRFAATVEADYDGVDVLCNNAGVMAIPRSETEDGFETQFGVNHLGHFALTGHLLDSLRDADDEARVVTQSSGVHERGETDFDDLQSEADYDKWGAYAQSKLANVLFAYELQRRLDRAGIDDVESVACHPGYADTDLQRRGPEAEGSTLGLWRAKALNAAFAQSAEWGALPMLYAATDQSVEGGTYVGPDGFKNMRGYPVEHQSSDRSYDEDAAERLWTVSEDLTGVTYDFG